MLWLHRTLVLDISWIMHSFASGVVCLPWLGISELSACMLLRWDWTVLLISPALSVPVSICSWKNSGSCDTRMTHSHFTLIQYTSIDARLASADLVLCVQNRIILDAGMCKWNDVLGVAKTVESTSESESVLSLDHSVILWRKFVYKYAACSHTSHTIHTHIQYTWTRTNHSVLLKMFFCKICWSL